MNTLAGDVAANTDNGARTIAAHTAQTIVVTCRPLNLELDIAASLVAVASCHRTAHPHTDSSTMLKVHLTRLTRGIELIVRDFDARASLLSTIHA
jgi:hypothetical protein